MAWHDDTTGWEPDAKAWLKLNAPTMPLAQLCSQFNALAGEGHWQPRSYQGIRHKISRLECRSKQQRRDTWPLEASEWLIENRRKYSPLSRLTQVYNQVALEQGWPQRSERGIEKRLGKRTKITAKLARHVINLATGERYDSAAIAGHAAGVDAREIREAIKSDEFCQGCKWAYIDDLQGGNNGQAMGA